MTEDISKYWTRGKLGIISCSSGEHFAEKVSSRLEEIIENDNPSKKDENVLIPMTERQFANTELKTEIDESIRNKDIYVFQDVENPSLGLSVNDNYMALKTAIIAAKSSDARHITAVVPVFPYARQDKPKTREGISAAMVARELEDAGATRVITLDIHQEATSGFFRKAVLENLRASKKIMDYTYDNIPMDDLVITSPDAGGAQRASFYARELSRPLAIMHKERDYSTVNSVEKMTLVGDVEGKDCLFVDDMIDTAGTTVDAIDMVKQYDANDVYFATSLPLLNGPAKERLQKSYDEGKLTKVIGTDVTYHDPEFLHETPWYDHVELDKYFAKVIHNLNQGDSISRLLL